MTKDQLKQLEADLWSAADNLRANSDLKSSEYAIPVLGLIFLKFADNNYRKHETEILAEYQKLKGTRREKKISDIAIEKCGFYLPDHARYDHLLNLPEEKDIAKALKEAMKAIEEYKPELDGVLPKDEYFRLTREVLDDEAGKQAVAELVKQWAGLNKLQARHEQYCEKFGEHTRPACGDGRPVRHSDVDGAGGGKLRRGDGVDTRGACDPLNKAQHQLREAFDPFFAALHEGLKQLDKIVRQHEKQQAEQAQKDGKRAATDRKTKALKTALEELHKEVKNAAIFYQHIHWLQERFPKAEYEDVTGLCKLANTAEVKEQEYSLNPGRYVGVVIEEDGKTEEEFIEELLTLNDDIESLAKKARQLDRTIGANVALLAGEA